MTTHNPRQGGDPEIVIRQAMRAMAGGRRGEQPAPSLWPAGRRRFTVTQVLLMAAIAGVVVGMAAGLAMLLL